MRTFEDQPDRQVVDLQLALKRLGGDEAMLRELIEIFLRETPDWMTRLEWAINQGDTDEVFRRAHDIKGSTHVFAAAAAVEAAQSLEQMGRIADLDGADEAFGVLQAELVWVRQALQSFS